MRCRMAAEFYDDWPNEMIISPYSVYMYDGKKGKSEWECASV